jgi:hypothetical protein
MERNVVLGEARELVDGETWFWHAPIIVYRDVAVVTAWCTPTERDPQRRLRASLEYRSGEAEWVACLRQSSHGGSIGRVGSLESHFTAYFVAPPTDAKAVRLGLTNGADSVITEISAV